jgi:hypothetical protein
MEKIYRNKKCLHFLYLLTQQNQPLSVKNMSKVTLDRGRTISEPTIKSWMKALKKGDDKFHFYPATEYSTIGLTPITVIHKSKKALELKEEAFLPKKINSAECMNISMRSKEFIESYLVLKSKVGLFKSAVKRQTENPTFLETKSEHRTYGKFHQMFSNEGHFFPGEESFSGKSMDNLRNYLKEDLKEQNNELLKYMFLARINTYCNSYQVWEELKEKIDVWKHLKKKERKDTIGIKYVQDLLKKAKVPIQNKLHYEKFTKNLQEYFIVGDFSDEHILEFAQVIGNAVFSLSVQKGKDKSILSMYTNGNGLNKSLNFLFEKGLKESTIFSRCN